MQLLSLQIIANPLFSQPSLFSASDSSNTACPAHQPSNCSTSSCYFYAAGFALGAAALGYFIGLKLGGGKSRVNTKVQVAKDLGIPRLRHDRQRSPHKVKEESPDGRGDELRLAAIHVDVTCQSIRIIFKILICYIAGSFRFILNWRSLGYT
ncbi:hypothetical protein Y032_0035g3138 [Ancylostoma ceylanicum]|uniref:Uncharacterized protein n=1 Tax=Ancylostoma ceylanicum TaxID=53326 RepID=A0A016UMF0_9BILA|nr:hypothetical protein Y032_0035g3138 [Ancylostoma ceylanicum]